MNAAARTAKANADNLALIERLGAALPDCGPDTTAKDAERAESIRAGLRHLARSLGLAC